MACWLTFALIASSAPVGGQQPTTNEHTPPLRDAYNTYSAERQARCRDPELQVYFSRTTCSPFDFTPDQLADSSTVTEDQKVALQKNRDQYEAQKKKLIEAMRKYGGPKDAASASLWEQLDVSEDRNFLDLYSGKITWGEYNRIRKGLAAQFRNEDAEIRNSH
jgi:hypothetical protein